MHYAAPIPIILGVVGAFFALSWLVAAGSDEDGGSDDDLFYLLGAFYIAIRVMKALFYSPMRVLPTFGIPSAAPA